MRKKLKATSARYYPAKKENLTVSIRIPDTLKIELEKLTNELGRGFSDFLQEGLDEWAKVNRDYLVTKKKA